MARILHKVTLEAPSSESYKALTDVSEIGKWFSKNTSGEGNVVGGKIKIEFGPGFHIFEVIELEENKKVVWKVVESKGPNDQMHEQMKIWDDTIITYNLVEKQLERLEGKTVTVMHFEHDGFPDEGDFFADCNFHWAYFLHSLKNLLEGKEAWPM
jgi:activator of HSP90 ATPase